MNAYSQLEELLPQAPSRFLVILTAVFRILILTLLFAALGMGLGLFFGIVGSIVYGLFKHTQVDMAMAYRTVAIPMAITSGILAFIYFSLTTIRRAVRHV